MRAWLTTPGPRRDLPLLALVLLVLYLAIANHGPFGSSNRYYEAAREMVELGDWTVPHLGYAPYMEKPPLVYWLGAAARLLGDHPLLTNLPSLLATLVSIFATYLWGCWWRGPGLGLGAAALLLGASFTQAMAGVLTTDPLLAACLAVAWVLWWRWDHAGRGSFTPLAGFYLAVAIGWLAKGPIALALPAAAIGLYALLGGGWSAVLRTLVQMRPWWGVATILLINLPWTLALWARDPRLVEFFYLRINLDAFVAGNYNHPAPWHFYLPVLAACLTPFTIVAFPLLVQTMGQVLARVRFQRYAWTATPAPDATRLFLACVVLGCFLLLSASSAKLGTYLMPIMPAVMLLLADHIARWTTTPRWVTVLFTAQAALFVVVGAVGMGVLFDARSGIEPGHDLLLAGFRLVPASDLSQLDLRQSTPLLLALGLLLLAASASIGVALRGRFRLALGLLAGGMALALGIAIPTSERLVPHRELTALIDELRARGGDDPALPPAQRARVAIHASSVHDYELLLALKRRAIIYGHARETGLGHFIEVTAPDVPQPGPGQPIHHPYEVSGNNTVHPWLWSDDELVAAWRGPTRVWLIGEISLVKQLDHLGVTAHVIMQIRHKALLSNQP